MILIEKGSSGLMFSTARISVIQIGIDLRDDVVCSARNDIVEPVELRANIRRIFVLVIDRIQLYAEVFNFRIFINKFSYCIRNLDRKKSCVFPYNRNVAGETDFLDCGPGTVYGCGIGDLYFKTLDVTLSRTGCIKQPYQQIALALRTVSFIHNEVRTHLRGGRPICNASRNQRPDASNDGGPRLRKSWEAKEQGKQKGRRRAANENSQEKPIYIRHASNHAARLAAAQGGAA